MAKCGECGKPHGHGHNAWCSQSPHPPPPGGGGRGTPRPDKQRPIKREDDGRKKR